MDTLKNPPSAPIQRINYIDWMKTFGMLFIIWGHTSLDTLSFFVYAFNVPLFFVVSGFLAKTETDIKLFFKKLFFNYFLPYLVLAIAKDAKYLIGHFTECESFLSILAILGGFHSIGDINGGLMLWFVYSIMVLKVIFQFMPNNLQSSIFVVAISIVTAITYRYFELDMYWGVLNAIIGAPFFYFGVFMSKNQFLIEKARKLTSPVKLVFILLSAIMIWYISNYNGETLLYNGDCGKNLILCYVEGILGTLLIFMVSIMLDKYDFKIVKLVSIGTLVILAFHRDINYPLVKFVKGLDFNYLVIKDMAKFVCSGITLLAFIPIIVFVKRFVPFLIGKRAKAI